MSDVVNAPCAMAEEPAREIFPVPEILRAQGIGLRPQRPEDLETIRNLYIDIRWDELAPTPWTDEQKVAFLCSQFDLQHRHYTTHYVGTEFYVIEQAGTAIGRFYLDRVSPSEIRVVDIAFFRQHAGKGYGSALIKAAQQSATATGRPLTMHVEQFNPARRLYARLGFTEVEERGAYMFIRWDPPAAA